MAKMRVRTPARAAATSRPPTVAPPPRAAGGTAWMLVALIGWIFCLAGFILMLRTISAQDRAMKNLQATLPRRINDLKEQAKTRQAAVVSRQGNVTGQLNKENESLSKIRFDVKTLQKEAGERDTEAARLEAQLEKLRAENKEARKNANLAVGALRDVRATQTQREAIKRKLKARYSKHYHVMLAELKARVKTGSGPQLRIFYSSRRHTPFAPYAGYLAAEAYYKAHKFADAAKIYQDIVERFSDSAYAGQAQTRLGQLQNKEPYDDAGSIGFQPYKALSFVVR